MTDSARVAALRRARQRQARIEVATARAVKARAALDRAIKARELSAERHDERVARAETASAAEAVDLAQVCGSIEATAEILGCSTRDVRRLVKADNERRTQTPNDQASRRAGRIDRSASTQPDARGNDDPIPDA